MASTGVTAANVMDCDGDSAELVAAFERAAELPIRLRFHPTCQPGTDRAGLEHLAARQGDGGRRWRIDGVKFYIDGTIDGGTAWLERPDVHGESRHPFWPDPGDYTAAMRYLAGRGVAIATHAIGDRGVRYVLDALDGLPAARVPHRVEHVETLPAALVGRFVAQGVTASMQPLHCTHFLAADQSDNWSRRLGPERAGRAFRMRDLVEARAVVALGRTGRSPPTTPAGGWPTRSCAAAGTSPTTPRSGRPRRSPRRWRWPATPPRRPGRTGRPTGRARSPSASGPTSPPSRSTRSPPRPTSWRRRRSR